MNLGCSVKMSRALVLEGQTKPSPSPGGLSNEAQTYGATANVSLMAEFDP